MTPAISLLVADHGELVASVPFVMPAFLIVGVLLVMRAVERKRDNPAE